MFDEFAYREFHVRAGVRQSRTSGGRWFGIISLAHDSTETTFSLADQLFDWPGAARRHAAHCAKELIDARLDGHGRAHDNHQPVRSASQ
jgi:hypothetical protein